MPRSTERVILHLDHRQIKYSLDVTCSATVAASGVLHGVRILRSVAYDSQWSCEMNPTQQFNRCEIQNDDYIAGD
jgi:hypothetical protein